MITVTKVKNWGTKLSYFYTKFLCSIEVFVPVQIHQSTRV